MFFVLFVFLFFVSTNMLILMVYVMTLGTVMEARIQFRIDKKTKELAQIAAKRNGSTLSDACRHLAEKLAEDQRKSDTQELWFRQIVDEAIDDIESGRTVLLSKDDAEMEMDRYKAEILEKYSHE
jgi:antitoxin component of RelBE/YafQ-DinJ toxin-antitoxin module